MSAKNFHSARGKGERTLDLLPDIYLQRMGYRGGGEFPALSRNTANLINRNLSYSYDYRTKRVDSDGSERTATPFSDFFSESETGTPDFLSEESDSSSGSVFRQNTEDATRALAAEWERIERTLYDEPGEKTKHPLMIEECQQWRQLFPQLRISGQALPLPEKKISYKRSDHAEIIAINYTDYEQFSEADERVSVSSNDITPQNSPRVTKSPGYLYDHIDPKLLRDKADLPKYDKEYLYDHIDPKLSRDKTELIPKYDKELLPDDFCSLLHITPIQIRSPPQKRLNSSIVKSDLASSKWMRQNRPDSSLHSDRNSAKSFVSLDTRNCGLILSASERNKVLGNRINSRYGKRLHPLYTPDLPPQEMYKIPTSMHSLTTRKVSLPPLMVEEEKRKMVTVSSPQKPNVSNIKPRRSISRSFLNLERSKF